MDGEQMDYKVYQMEVEVKAKVIVYVRECNAESALDMAKDKIEEKLIDTFSEVNALEMYGLGSSQIEIYQ